MLKKNLIGIVIVLLVFAGFSAGYMFGKGSGGSTSGMTPGMQGAEQAPSSPRPAFLEQGMPEGSSVENGEWVKAQQNGDSTASTSFAMNVAWAEPMDTPQVEAQTAILPEERTRPALTETPKDTLIQQQDAAVLTQTFYGTVVPYAEANVQSTQGGTITFLNGREGDAVKKGDVLVRFDDRDTQFQLQQAIASKNSAIQQVNQTESNFQTIQANVKRYQELFDEGFVSKQQVDDLQNQLTSAMSSFNSAKESVTQSEVQIKIIENTLTDFQVRAPISGLIDVKNYNLSEIYQGGAVIYHLIDIEQVYVEVEIPETYLKQVREGMAVSVVFDAIGEQPFSGTLETILPSGTSDNRSFTAKVLVQNPELSIKPGMFARIEMNTDGSTI